MLFYTGYTMMEQIILEYLIIFRQIIFAAAFRCCPETSRRYVRLRQLAFEWFTQHQHRWRVSNLTVPGGIIWTGIRRQPFCRFESLPAVAKST